MFLMVALMAALSDDELIAQLGDDRFVVREQATAQLEKRIDFPMYLRLRDAQYDDVEIQLRVKQAVEQYEIKMVSAYSVKLGKGKLYPPINQAIADDYKLSEGLWEYWSADDFIQKYLDHAKRLFDPDDELSYLMQGRLATELFVEDRIRYVGYSALHETKTEEEFYAAMQNGMANIQKDVEGFFLSEGKYQSSAESVLFRPFSFPR